jgi:hypothetical protein
MPPMGVSEYYAAAVAQGVSPGPVAAAPTQQGQSAQQQVQLPQAWPWESIPNPVGDVLGLFNNAITSVTNIIRTAIIGVVIAVVAVAVIWLYMQLRKSSAERMQQQAMVNDAFKGLQQTYTDSGKQAMNLAPMLL